LLKDRIREIRKLRGYTLQQMADKLNMALRSYQHYESGYNIPPVDTLVKIADILNVSIDYLLERDDFLKSLGVNVDLYKTNLQGYPTN